MAAFRVEQGMDWEDESADQHPVLRVVTHGDPPDQLATVAAALATFVAEAQSSDDVASFDFRLSDLAVVNAVVDALTAAADRGVTTLLGYEAGKPANGTAADFAALEMDPRPAGTAVRRAPPDAITTTLNRAAASVPLSVGHTGPCG